MPIPRSRYKIDLNVHEGQEGYSIICNTRQPIGYKNLQQTILDLKAIEKNNASKNKGSTSTNKQQQPVLSIGQQNVIVAKKNKIAMSIGLSPGQALGMNTLMLWLGGSQLNVFSISTTSSAILTPLSNLFNVETVFKQFISTPSSTSTSTTGTSTNNTTNTNTDIDITVPKLIFIALNLLWLCIGLYKMSSMRLLPTTSADFTYKLSWKEMVEYTSIPP